MIKWILNIIVNYYPGLYQSHCQATSIQISVLTSSTHRISSTAKSKPTTPIVYAKCELDSHADTTVAGSNCVVLSYTGKECDVTPYRDDYQPVQNIPIVSAATAWQSPTTGQTYILVFNEALWWVTPCHPLSSIQISSVILGLRSKTIQCLPYLCPSLQKIVISV